MNAFIIGRSAEENEQLAMQIAMARPEITVAGHVTDYRSAVDWLKDRLLPDILFLTTAASAGDCVQMFRNIRLTCPIIFTGDPQDSLSILLRAQNLPFIPLPVDNEHVRHVLSILPGNQAKLKSSKATNTEIRQRQRFLVRQGQRWQSIDISDVAWFRAEGKLCFLRTWDKRRFIIDFTLEELVGMIDRDKFFRVNRSYIVHIRSIRTFAPYFGGKLILEMNLPVEGDPVVVSKERAADFKVWMGK